MPNDILDTEDATFDTTTGHWSALQGAISRTTSPTPHAGGGNLTLTGVAGTAVLADTNLTTVPDGSLVTATAWMRQSSGNSDQVNRYVVFSAGDGNAPWWPGDTAAWQELEVRYVTLPAASRELSAKIVHDSGFPTSGTGYLSDVNVTHAPVSAPHTLTATVISPTQINLAWTNDNTTQQTGTSGYEFGGPSVLFGDIANQEKISVERSTDGGAFSEIVAITNATTTTRSDTTVTAGHTYRYRIRYRIYQNGSKTGAVAFSAYSNIAGDAVGGWGVGMVRMGAN